MDVVMSSNSKLNQHPLIQSKHNKNPISRRPAMRSSGYKCLNLYFIPRCRHAPKSHAITDYTATDERENLRNLTKQEQIYTRNDTSQ